MFQRPFVAPSTTVRDIVGVENGDIGGDVKGDEVVEDVGESIKSGLCGTLGELSEVLSWNACRRFSKVRPTNLKNFGAKSGLEFNSMLMKDISRTYLGMLLKIEQHTHIHTHIHTYTHTHTPTHTYTQQQ